jgi:hypothetical protein
MSPQQDPAFGWLKSPVEDDDIRDALKRFLDATSALEQTIASFFAGRTLDADGVALIEFQSDELDVAKLEYHDALRQAGFSIPQEPEG